ncbi:AAA family ATPase [Desulfococcaceae bacterium HSG8]|nr:AAA family ATPase [Desulfococcaceae bacterium HSG8]
MITHIKITGFKSFHNFEMTFTPLTVVAGVNASGKSNLFDALHLLSRLAETDLKTAFSEQRGDPIELFTKYGEDRYASDMEFTVEMLLHRHVRDNWGGEAELNNTRLRYTLAIARKTNDLGIDDLIVKHEGLEKIPPKEDTWAKEMIPKEAILLWKAKRAGGSKVPFIETIRQNERPTIKIRQDGRQSGKRTPANAVSQTVIGGINSVDFPHAFAAKEEMRSWMFLQLSPRDLREPTRQDIGLRDTITPGGKNLAAALYRIRQTDLYSLKEISRKLNSFLPNYTEVKVYDDKVNRQFIIRIEGEDGKAFSSQVLSEGTLRLLALCVLEQDDKHTGLLCFEEPENGIHPFRMEAMAHLLRDLSIDFTDADMPLRQVIVNTHSPVLVNQLLQWKDDNDVSVCLSRLNSLITETDGTKNKIKITKMSPVLKQKDKSDQLSFFPVSEPERKVTLAEVIDYLETADTENTIKDIRSDE